MLRDTLKFGTIEISILFLLLPGTLILYGNEPICCFLCFGPPYTFDFFDSLNE